MIIELLFDVVYWVFYAFTLPISIPSLPTEIHTYIDTIIQYLGTGIAILSNYCHMLYLLTLFGVIIAVEIGVGLYNVVMFIIKKIPMLGIQ